MAEIEFYREDRLDAACEEYRLAKQHFDQAEQVMKMARQMLTDVLAERGQKSHKYRDGLYTLVRSERLTFNETGLRKAIGARLYNKLTVRKLDTKKLEQAVERGDVDHVVLAQHSEIKESEPFVRMTISKS